MSQEEESTVQEREREREANLTAVRQAWLPHRGMGKGELSALLLLPSVLCMEPRTRPGMYSNTKRAQSQPHPCFVLSGNRISVTNSGCSRTHSTAWAGFKQSLGD